MANYAIIKDTLVINVCSWDGVTPWQPPEETEVIEILDNSPVGVGYTYVNEQFIPPSVQLPQLTELEDPLAFLSLEQKQALAELLKSGTI